jgi:hypothetical protein
MKTLAKVALAAAILFTAAKSHAEVTGRDTTSGHKISHTATKVGHKTSEIAAKGASDVVDKKYEGKVGPGGQTIYINKNSHYYYINKLGHRVYVSKSKLRDK